ncbi:MAG: BTAD domain-containing putative transcriptional regulator [Caldilineaceae bacterium]
MHLSISLFGHCAVAVDKNAIASSRTKKIEALLAYLVVESDHAHRSETLTGLLFPDMADEVASTNLRQTLTRLRRAIRDDDASPPFLTIERETLQFNRQSDHWCDLFVFTTLLTGCAAHSTQRDDACIYCMTRLREAVELYRGSLLADFFLADSAPFEEWAATQRERLQQEALATLRTLTTFYTRRGEYAQAIIYAQRQLGIEPWHEEAHQLLIRLLARMGQRTAALAQYKRCVAALQTELNVAPSAATNALRNQVAALVGARPHNLPMLDNTFVGRANELAGIYEHFSGATTRLITLVGAGGIGKTRLALEVAWRIAREYLGPFMHGVYFVGLVDLSTAVDVKQTLILAIADGLGLGLGSTQAPLTVVLNYLQGKELLLILDNCEEAGDAIDLLTQLLHHAPGLQILATALEPLDLINECLIRLDGLPFPPAAHHFVTADSKPAAYSRLPVANVRLAPAPVGGKLESYQAVQLFVQRARQVDPCFSLEAEALHVLRICQLTEGMPLAIELAARWLKSLSCAGIAGEMERSLDMLATTARNVPDRHRSLHAVFDHSWRMLSAHEQAVLQRLSIFRGSFDRTAAAKVATASLHDMATLVEKSLVRLRKGARGERYDLHELLRQFAAAKLTATLRRETQQRYVAYFVDLVEDQCNAIGANEPQQWIDKITTDLENIYAVLSVALEREELEIVLRLVGALRLFWTWKNRHVEAMPLVRKTVALADQHWTFDRALQNVALESIAVDRVALDDGLRHRVNTYVAALLAASEVFLWSDREQAAAWLKRSRELDQLTGVKRITLHILRNLAQTEWARGAYAEADQLYHELLAAAHQLTNIDPKMRAWEIAVALQQLGWFSFLCGDLSKGKRLAAEALAIFQAIEEPRFIAYTIHLLGDIALHAQDFGAAKRYFTQSLAQFAVLEDVNGLQWSLYGMSMIALHDHKREEARTNLLQCLGFMRVNNTYEAFLFHLRGLAEVEFLCAHYPLAAQLLGAAKMLEELSHYCVPPIFTADFERVDALIRSHLSEAEFFAAYDQGYHMTPEQAIDHALNTS